VSGPIDQFTDSVKFQIRDMLLNEASRIAGNVEQTLNNKLGSIAKGDTLFGVATVIDATADSLTIQVRGRAAIKAIKTTVFYRAVVVVGRTVTITSSEPVIEIKSIPSLMADAKLSLPKIGEGALGFGWEGGWPPTNIVGHGLVDVSSLGMRLELFLGGLTDYGIAVSLSAGSSRLLLVPLGASGLGLRGVGGTFAVNMEPRLDVTGISSATNPTAADYVVWAQRAADRELDSWQPASDSYAVEAGGFGITADVVTMVDSGFLLALRDAGFLILFPGPLALFGGTGMFFATDEATVRADLVISFIDGSIAARANADVRLRGVPGNPWKIIDASGVAEAFFSFSNPSAWYLNLGTRKNPISISMINGSIAGVSGFLMLNNSRFLVGGSLNQRFGPVSKFGVTAKALFELGGSALVGWNPIEVAVGFNVRGELSLKVWKVKAGFELWAGIIGKIPRPVDLLVEGGAKINLPFPADDVEWEGTLVEWKQSTPPELRGPMRASSVELTLDPEVEPLGAVHPVTGRQWRLSSSAEETVWPDVELVVPFNRRVRDRTTPRRVVGPEVRTVREGGFTVEHDLETLRIMQLNGLGAGPSETEMAQVLAVWVSGPGKTMSRLHVNAEDPFAWLAPYEVTLNASRATPEELIEQSFLNGESETLTSGAVRSFGTIGAKPLDSRNDPAHLIAPPPWNLATRVLITKRIELSFLDSSGGAQSFSDYVRLILVGKTTSTVKWQERTVRAVAVKRLQADTWLVAVDLPLNGPQPSIVVEGPAGGPVHGAPQPLVLYRVMFRRASPALKLHKRIILQPGRYRLDIAGHSRIHGGPGPDISWTRSQTFKIAVPDELRPYVRHTTIGDSRIFGYEGGLWNPTSHGLGFPIYSAYLGVIRFKVPYATAVFGDGWEISISNTNAPPRVYRDRKPVGNPYGESSALLATAQWLAASGGSPPGVDQEITVPSGLTTGSGTIRLGLFPVTSPGAPATTLDEWAYEASRFANFAAHLVWNGTPAARSIGATGPTAMSSAPIKSNVTAALDLTAHKLKETLAACVGPLKTNSGADYFKFLHAAGVSLVAGARFSDLLTPVPQTTLDVVLDADSQPVALWIRTPEPVDWRRVAATLHVSRAQAGVILETRIIPSPDATAALIVARTVDAAVCLPRGDYRIRLSYSMSVPGLPRLRRDDAVNGVSTDEQVGWSPFGLPFGA